MNVRIPALAIAAVLVQSAAMAGPTMSHPESAYPDSLPPLVSPGGPFDDFIMAVQEKLHQAGFDAGPVNGNFGIKTQTALGQFQLSQSLPASGALDDATLKALGVERPASEESATSAPPG
jgi:peptidoglycan hydrolase-like protein with peptidoglycan-binding domain